MSIIGMEIKEENKLDPALFTAMFVAVFFLPFFIAFQNYTLSFLAVLVMLSSYMIINYTSMYLEIDTKNNMCSVFKHKEKLAEYPVREVHFSWHALVLTGGGSLYQNAGSEQQTSRRQNRLQCLLTLEEGAQIRLINEQWPWEGLPKGWDHRVRLDNYTGVTYFVKRDLVMFASNYKKAIAAIVQDGEAE